MQADGEEEDADACMAIWLLPFLPKNDMWRRTRYDSEQVEMPQQMINQHD